jgi:hypothetical protein
VSGATSERGSALVLTILLLALAGVLATALAELGRAALARARLDRDGVRAAFVAEGGLAETLAALPPGWSFTSSLRDASDAPPAAGDPWTYGVAFVDDADDVPADDMTDGNARVTLRIAAFGPAPVRRRLDAVLGRSPDPYFPGAVTLGGEFRSLTADFLLDGRDFDMSSGCSLATDAAPRAGLSLPDGAGLPLFASPEQVRGRGPAPSVARAPAPPFDEVADADGVDTIAAGTLAPTLGDPAAPQFLRIDGDATADGVTTGAGVLFVAGRLHVTGHFSYRGVVAATDGITVAAGATLEVCGGAYAAGTPALDVLGSGFVRASAAALRMAATLAPLPAPARVVAVREPS